MDDSQEIHRILAALDAATASLDEARSLLQARLPTATDRIGKAAHLHLQVLEREGKLTVADSLSIRRELYGDRVRGSASLFGRPGEGALFFRDVKYGTRTKPGQTVHLTQAGKERARRYREDRGLDLGTAAAP